MNTFVKAVLIVVAGAYTSRADTPSTVWIRQFGTNSLDQPFALTGDSLGNLYVAGSTSGNLAGATSGGSDAFITSFDSAGILRWSRQRGTGGLDTYYGAAADSAGGIYLTGITEGSFGGPNAGKYDSFLTKYDVT